MARPSSIQRLPAELLRLIVDRRHAGRTIDEIRSELLERGARVSRSALQRHTRRLDDAAPAARFHSLREDLRAIRKSVEAIAAKLSGRDG